MSAKWFSIKTFFRSYADGRPEKPDKYYDPDATMVEERITFIRAKSAKEAVAKAQREAKIYADHPKYLNPYGQQVSTKFLGFCEVYELERNPSDKVEIFSTTRIMSKRIYDKKIAHVYMGKGKENQLTNKRKKFINKEYLESLK